MPDVNELEKRLEQDGWRYVGLFEYPSSIAAVNRLLKPYGLKLRSKSNYKNWGDALWLRLERIAGVDDLEEKIREVITYYAAGVGDGHYEQLMDELTNTCSEPQWEEVNRALDKVDEWMAETDQATLAQKERVAARREGRTSRYPGALVRTLMSAEEINRTLRELEAEHGVKAPEDAFA
jgi:hypothetical protein